MKRITGAFSCVVYYAYCFQLAHAERAGRSMAYERANLECAMALYRHEVRHRHV